MTTVIKDVLLDIIKHTHGLGIIDNIKVSGATDGTKLAAMDKDKTVIMTADLHDVVAEFEGEFGLGSLGLLSSLTKLSNYSEPGASIIVERGERQGEELPTTLVFKDTGGGKDQYRFMSKKIVDEAMKVATFKGAQWDLQIQPALRSVSQLSEVASIYSGVDPAFAVKTEDGNLIFEVGSTEGGVIGRRVFSENVENTLTTTWQFPLAQFLSIIKLGGTTLVSFSNQGACKIEVDSGIGVYTYIMPAISG
jgi:hypothetical protein|tara:strand:+ start:3928 stop:4677 length:750 start_codon:yes stop_codon:yes gene_type:complete